MKRDLQQLSRKEYDLLIIGGGIYGACIAREGSLRGLSVALVEKGDFGNATSSNSLKTIHGGLRYLQHADFKRMRESIRERSNLMHLVPHLVHPIPFLMPTYGLKKGKTVMAIALFLNDLISFDRNSNSDPQKKIPGGRIISRSECIKLFPEVNKNGLTGGAIWYDCYTYNSERLLLSFLLSAAKVGADLANYLKVTGFLEKGKKINGVTVEDEIRKERFDIRAKITVNAAGPWIDNVLNLLKSTKFQKRFYPSIALNIITPAFCPKNAIAIHTKDLLYDDAVSNTGSRLLIVLPWRNHSIIGTVHLPYEGQPDKFTIEERVICNLINEFNSCNTNIKLKREDVSYVYSGLLPMEKNNGRRNKVVLTKLYKIYDHKKDEGIDGLITVLGVKYTTARDVAEKVINLVIKMLGKESSKSNTIFTPVYGGNIERLSEFISRETKERSNAVSTETTHHLIQNYGSAYTDILNYINEDQNNSRLVSEKSNTKIIKAEIIHSIREEMALKLSDVIFRRTESGTVGNLGNDFLQSCAAIMANELGWDSEKTKTEINEVNKIFNNMAEHN